GKDDIYYSVFLRLLSTIFIVLYCDIYGLKLPGFLINEVQILSPNPLTII
ncbi:hypothetical protein QBC40DRAFT_188606, partial [Triangularia verruculosa]